jgi:hypothetical protein
LLSSLTFLKYCYSGSLKLSYKTGISFFPLGKVTAYILALEEELDVELQLEELLELILTVMV